MKFTEIVPDKAQLLTEAGRTHSFPGFGNKLFGQRHYEYLATQIGRVADEDIRNHILNWVVTACEKDNPRFKTDLFRRVVGEKKSYGASPEFAQRHLFYLAGFTAQIGDAAEREFVAHWLADLMKRQNPAFKEDRWFKVCNAPQAAA